MINSILNYKQELINLPDTLANSPFKKNYIIKQMGMPTPTFYRKLKNLTFTADEMLAIAKIIKPQETALIELKESIERGKNDFENGNITSHEDVVSKIEKLIK